MQCVFDGGTLHGRQPRHMFSYVPTVLMEPIYGERPKGVPDHIQAPIVKKQVYRLRGISADGTAHYRLEEVVT
jgi:hypothetical protein